jgi:hypothetical protein
VKITIIEDTGKPGQTKRTTFSVPKSSQEALTGVITSMAVPIESCTHTVLTKAPGTGHTRTNRNGKWNKTTKCRLVVGQSSKLRRNEKRLYDVIEEKFNATPTTYGVLGGIADSLSVDRATLSHLKAKKLIIATEND